MRFQHEVIDPAPPCGRLGICLPTDLTGNGRPDLLVGGMGRTWERDVLGRTVYPRNMPVLGELLKRRETSLFWYENPGWERHAISTTPDVYVFGNALGDIDGDGRLDLVVGQGYGARDIYWYRQPPRPQDPWERRRIASDFEKYHDLLVADIDGDGAPEVIGCSQGSETVFYYDVPADPTVQPWPDSCLHVIADDLDVEGLAVADLDGDGALELIAGPVVFSRAADGGWERDRIVTGWEWTRVAVADLDGDGDPEVVLAEGDSPLLGSHPGRVAWFDPPDWAETRLADDLYCPHTLQVGDLTGDGHPDVYVAEMGVGNADPPAHVLFRNRGDATFERCPLEGGVPTHEAKLVDVDGDGRLDVVGKSYAGDTHVDVWYNHS